MNKHSQENYISLYQAYRPTAMDVYKSNAA